MNIGINARFLRKQGTGIGQVTREFLRALSKLPEATRHTFFLYVEEPPTLDFSLPTTWHIRVIRSWYERDDLIREHLFERFTLPRAAQKDKCETFLSLSQSATILPPTIRHVMLVHDLVPLHFPEYLESFRRRFFYRRVLRAIRSASTLIVPSHATKEDITEQLSLSHDEIYVAPLGLASIFEARPKPETVDAILKTYGLQRGYIYHGGGLEKRKNTALLLETYAALLSEGRNFPPLVISGKIHTVNNPLATNVLALVEKYRLEGKVRLLGFVPDEDLPSLYAGALFFVYPSLYEGFGLPVLEAFGSGSPVLASNISSLPEVAGDAALLCDPTDGPSFKNSMKKLIDGQSLREELSQKGLERAKLFSWKRCVQTAFSHLLQ